MVKFDWDITKAKQNLKKHKVSFENAVRAFSDPFSIHRQDRIVDGEERWQMLGMVDNILIMFVAYVIIDDEENDIIRIISARKATRKERKIYHDNQTIHI